MEYTAVEWLIDKHFGGIDNCTPDFRYHIEQAKEMEKQKDAKYNEMLDMLIKFTTTMDVVNNVIKAKQLIKEATELKQQ